MLTRSIDKKKIFKRRSKKRRIKGVLQSAYDLDKLPFQPPPTFISTRHFPIANDCNVHRIYQEYGTCWIASVVFLVKNNKHLWDLMNRTVQVYTNKYFSAPLEATAPVSYDLRNATSTCRTFPPPIAQWYLYNKFEYVDNNSGGNPDQLLISFLRVSNVKYDTLTPWNQLSFFDPPRSTSQVVILTLYAFNKELHLFESRLYELAQKASKVYNDFFCVGGFVHVGYDDSEHVMGFVACNNVDTDYLLCQSWDIASCVRLSKLAEKPTFRLGYYDGERTRSQTKLRIHYINFIYVRMKRTHEQGVNKFRMIELRTFLENEFAYIHQAL